MSISTRKSLNYVLLFIYAVYFALFLSGGYAPHIDKTQAADPSLFENLMNKGKAKKPKASLSAPERSGEDDALLAGEFDKPEQSDASPAYTWKKKTGQIGLVLLQGRALREFQDPILESEAKPDLLFEELRYGYAANLSKLLLTGFWLVCILLCFLALYKGHWFYRPMSSIVFLISAFIVLLHLGGSRKIEMDIFRDITIWPQIFAGLELALVFLSAALLLSRTLPSEGLGLKSEFMEHLRIPVARINERINDLFRTIVHVGVLIFAGLVLSNLLLLPLYKAQLNLQGVFIFLILLLLVVLGIWYIRAYTKLVKDQGREAHTTSGVAFLGYRFLKNTLFISVVVFLVSLVFSLILVLTMYNTSILQDLHLLPIEKSL